MGLPAKYMICAPMKQLLKLCCSAGHFPLPWTTGALVYARRTQNLDITLSGIIATGRPRFSNACCMSVCWLSMRHAHGGLGKLQ